jgi:hypothetical protein
MFTELIGDYLIKEEDTKTNTTWERVNPNLPSPDALRYKILIKHKKCIVKERKASTNSQAIAENLTKSAASSSSLASSQSPEIVSDVRCNPCRLTASRHPRSKGRVVARGSCAFFSRYTGKAGGG